MQRIARTTWKGWLTALVVFVGTGAAAYLIFDRGLWDLDVIERGKVSVTTTESGAARTVTASTRLVELTPTRYALRPAGGRLWQVQLPDDRWVACEGDCAAVLKRELAR